ncbi:hypothetical protein SERLA73DRAFT_96776 [Serpula lacrymans var. lacrymans S7.3]|uniref:RRM domain-containing protein n=1 Tax=Serpula lacrymans var. lacrymans (strain S7.3) TaxID=936435 RepID=F8QBI8_SERL3|nr:hypothetical protein SERLA73DRAFT_96776 [Serpula lacrymans var. lacrymans S7.3]
MSSALGKRKARDEDTVNDHGSTLFVSNLPYTATSTDLQTLFSDFAPVRTAFVVLEHGTGVSKGVGYVSFAIKEDAVSAFDTITENGITLQGRKLRTQWADSKPKDKEKGDVVKEPKARPTSHVSHPQKVNDPLAIRTIVISGLPTSIDAKTLWKKIRKHKGAEKVDWPAKTAEGDEDATSATVIFATSALAQEAVNKLHAHVFKGCLLSVTLKKRQDNLATVPAKKTKGPAPNRSSRLIVRNLPFDLTEQDLRAIFLPHGPIYSIHIPMTKSQGTQDSKEEADDSTAVTKARAKGFAFVWMLSKKDAEQALAKCNGMKVRAGMAEHIRVIAVDWALSKEKWQEEISKMEGEVEDGDVDMTSIPGRDEEDEDSDSNSENQSEDESQDDDDDNLGVHEDGEDSSNSEFSDGEVEDGGEAQDQEPVKPQLPPPESGTTLFVRNVPFEADEDELRTLFRTFGPLRYARITVDPETGRSRGTGFACFWNKVDADKVVEQSDILRAETTGSQPQLKKNPFTLPSILTPDPSSITARSLVLHGRTLDVVRAVTRDEAGKLKEDGEKRREKADKRNLYLLREGVITPNSPDAETLTPTEVEKRTLSFNARRALLRSNPSLYISKTRLSVRQVPLFVSERVLKRLAIHATRAFEAEVKKGSREGLSPDELSKDVEEEEQGEKNDVPVKEEKNEGKSQKQKKGGRPTSVKQSKIVRQQDRVDPVTGKGRSRGYGFIEMHKHADALRVLRWANNNEDIIPLLDKWWKVELEDLIKQEKAKDDKNESRVKRMKDELENHGPKTGKMKSTLIVEFSIENVEVVQRRAAHQKEKSETNTKKPVDTASSKRHQEPSFKKRRLSTDGGKDGTVLHRSDKQKPDQNIGSIIGRKRKERKSGRKGGG